MVSNDNQASLFVSSIREMGVRETWLCIVPSCRNGRTLLGAASHEPFITWNEYQNDVYGDTLLPGLD